MARNPELEALLQAKYDLDTAGDEHKVAREREYFAKLDEIITRSGMRGATRHQIEEVFLDAYREFAARKSWKSAPSWGGFGKDFP